ncbi:hypothetical protein D3C84_864550 [compost metagenome]
MDQNDVWLDPGVGGVQLCQQLLRQAVEGLVLGHYPQVFIHAQTKVPKHLLKHFPVLAGGADVQLDVRPQPQYLRQGGHLDRFRTGTEHHHDFVGHCCALFPLL